MSDRGSLGLPDRERRAWLLESLGELLRRADGSHFVCAPIVLPTPAFFPDRWTRSVAGVERLLRRLFAYADLDELTPTVQLYEGEPPEPRGSGELMHHEGAAGLFLGIEDELAYFGADASLLDDPGGITATLAHEVGHAYRAHHGLCVADRELEEPLTDLTSVFLGFGVLAANAALRHRSGITGDTFFASRWSVSRLGYLTPQELCFLLAAQAHLRGPERAPVKPLLEHLEANQAGFFKESLKWLQRERPDLVTTLGLPPRSSWPPLDSLAALTRPFDETHDETEVDLVVAAPAAPAPSNVGKPVFRVWKRPREQQFTLCLGLLVPAFLAALAVSSSPILVIVVIAVTVPGMHLAGRYLQPRCSDPDCGAKLTALMATTCPGCGGTIRGDIQRAERRLAAEEALTRARTQIPGLPRKRA